MISVNTSHFALFCTSLICLAACSRSIGEGANAVVVDGEKVIEKIVWYNDTKANIVERYYALADDTSKVHGMHKTYYVSGEVMQEIPYRHGMAQGEGRSYYESGALSGRVQYENSMEQGLYISYYDNGRVRDSTEYRDGAVWNIISVFDSSGVKLDAGGVQNGNGIARHYNPDGTLLEQGPYVNGKREGEWIRITGSGDTGKILFEKGYWMIEGERFMEVP